MDFHKVYSTRHGTSLLWRSCNHTESDWLSYNNHFTTESLCVSWLVGQYYSLQGECWVRRSISFLLLKTSKHLLIYGSSHQGGCFWVMLRLISLCPAAKVSGVSHKILVSTISSYVEHNAWSLRAVKPKRKIKRMQKGKVKGSSF